MPPAPKEPNADNKPADPQSFLLPKKEEAPATRANAGALLAQEQAATLKPTGGEVPPQGRSAGATGPTTRTEDSTSPQAPQPKQEESMVTPLQTYKSDIERVVEKGASVISIAAAEADKPREPQKPPAQLFKEWGTKAAMIVGGVLLLAVAAGAIYFVATRPSTTEVVAQPQAPFISIDSTMVVEAPTSTPRDMLMNKLVDARQRSKLSLGLVEWVYVARDSKVGPQVNSREFITSLAPLAPQELLRTFTGTYLLGVHSFDENQAFLLIQVDSYETAYAALLQWERTMYQELLPLFNRNPSPTAPTINLTASSTASTTQQKILPTNFVDKVVQNRDTRVLLDTQGNIRLLWTMLGRNTVLITTNEYTLREVVSRIHTVPIVPHL